MRYFLLALLALSLMVPEGVYARKGGKAMYIAPQAEYQAWFDSNVSVTRSMDVFQTVDARRLSPNENYWYTVTYALIDRPENKRLDYSIHIYKGGDYFINLTLFDVLMDGVPEVRWINDKLLYVEFWWRSKMGAYMIFDVENEYITARDMIFTEPPARMGSYQNFKALR